MNWINLTSHLVSVFKEDGSIRSFHPSGVVARVVSTQEVVKVVDKIKLCREVNKVVNLPPPMKNTYYIVSYYVAKELPQRTDLVVPGDKFKHPATGQTNRVSTFIIN